MVLAGPTVAPVWDRQSYKPHQNSIRGQVRIWDLGNRFLLDSKFTSTKQPHEKVLEEEGPFQVPHHNAGLWEAVKKVMFLVVRPLREGKGRTTKEKELLKAKKR